MKKYIIISLAAILVLLELPLPAIAAKGFYDGGDYSDSRISYSLRIDETVHVYNNEVYSDPEYNEIWAGSQLYIPIYRMGDGNGDDRIATEKEIKESKVKVSYKSSIGEKYIQDVTIADGKKAKLEGLDPGAYVRVDFINDYAGLHGSSVDVKLVLSVNNISYQNTMAGLSCIIVNWMDDIRKDSVYGAHQPSGFRIVGYTGNTTFDFGDKIRYLGYVKQNDRYYLNLHREANEAIAAMYPKVYLEYYQFWGDKDIFPKTGQLQIPIVRSKFKDKKTGKTTVFVYQIMSDNTLKAMDEAVLSFNGKTNILTIHTKNLESYLLSSQPLMKEVVGEDDNIIYTGYASALEETTPAK